MGEKGNIMGEKQDLSKIMANFLRILYWGISILAGFIFGLYTIYHVIEAPQPGIGERIILAIFALIAIFFSWAFPIIQFKILDYKKYTNRFIIMLIVAYFIIRLIIQGFGLNIYTM